jgi:hypothetical protein
VTKARPLAIGIIYAAIAIHLWLMTAQDDPNPKHCLAINRLFPGLLTCQKSYHYQPDPFTG